MKAVVISSMLLFACVSCDNNKVVREEYSPIETAALSADSCYVGWYNEDQRQLVKVNMLVSSSGDKFGVVEIDSCEYLFRRERSGLYSKYGFMTHKGNCRFCAARSKRK